MKNVISRGFILVIVLSVVYSCSCGFWGDNDLGDNFSLLEGDKIADRVIVYCTERSGRCCHSGIPVIPSRTDSLTRYVINAYSDKNWIIAKTKQTNEMINFWIIDKNLNEKFEYDDGGKFYETIQSHIIGPLNEIEFNKQLEKRNINLKFKH